MTTRKILKYEKYQNMQWNKVLDKYGLWTQEELSDRNKKLYYMTSNLEKKNGLFHCFICPYKYHRSGSVINHISRFHPRLVHKLSPWLHRIRENAEDVALGIASWTKEELADPNKKLFYRTAQLERVDRRYMCFCCEYSCLASCQIIRHIASNHPKFVHVPPQNISTESLSTPLLARKTVNSLASTYIFRQSRSTKSVDYSEPELPPYNNSSYTETMGENRERGSTDGAAVRGDSHLEKETIELIGPDLQFMDKNVTVEPMVDKNQIQRELEDFTVGNVEVDVESLNEDTFSIECSDVVEMDCVVIEEEENQTRNQQHIQDLIAYKDALLREYQAENEHLTHSISSLQTAYEREIAKLQEELHERSAVELNQLLCPKEEPSIMSTFSNSRLTSDQTFTELQRRMDVERKTFDSLIATKDEEMENLKAKMSEKQTEWENERKRAKEREEEMDRNLLAAELALKKIRKVIELKEKAEKLKLEEQLEEQRLMEAEREAELALEVLAEKRRTKVERLKEILKIQDELSFFH